MIEQPWVVMKTITFSQRIEQEPFSRKGLDFGEQKPTSRQSSCSCSIMYFIRSSMALLTLTRFTAASRRNCSFIWRCCWRFDITMSITKMRLSFGHQGRGPSLCSFDKVKLSKSDLRGCSSSSKIYHFFIQLENLC